MEASYVHVHLNLILPSLLALGVEGVHLPWVVEEEGQRIARRLLNLGMPEEHGNPSAVGLFPRRAVSSEDEEAVVVQHSFAQR
jgi:hypothetical protein